MWQLPPAGQKGARELLRRGQQAYLSHGITTAQDGFMKQAEAQLLAEAARAGELALDVVGYCDMKENAGLPGRLRDAGVPADALPRLAADAMKQTRLLVNNPRPVTEADALAIYAAAW